MPHAQEVSERLSKLNKSQIGRLLAVAKRKRGLRTDQLVFVGVSNIAKHWWCTQKAVLKSRQEEEMFFTAYLSDRLNCALCLGKIDRLPSSDQALLDIGRELTLADRESLISDESATAPEVTFAQEERQDARGRWNVLINPDLPRSERDALRRAAEAEGKHVVSVSADEEPLLRGDLAHMSPPEKYPAFRWAFPWEELVVVGVPDGLTNGFVYEYKTTRNQFLLRFMKPVAFAQADLYGWFFQRSGKRVQINIVEERKTETFDEPVNVTRCHETLAAFALVANGGPAIPPTAWKCRNCEFNAKCPISQAR